MFKGNRLSLFGYIEKTKPKCQKDGFLICYMVFE